MVIWLIRVLLNGKRKKTRNVFHLNNFLLI